MSKLDEAEKRLQRAITDLEAAARARPAAAPDVPSDPAGAGLDAAQARNAELEALNASVAEKLDDAILRVKKILED